MNSYSKSNPPPGHYVYAYMRDDGSPYYIGKGKGKRAWLRSDRTVFAKPNGSNVVILEANLTDIGALAIERRMIEWYGRIDIGSGILHNKTDGGDGNAGWVPSDIVKQKISVSKTGKPVFSADARAQMSKSRSGNGHWNFGRKWSQDVINRNRQTNKDSYARKVHENPEWISRIKEGNAQRQSKIWTLRSPDGEIVTIFNLAAHAKKHGYYSSGIISNGKSKGWHLICRHDD